MPYAKIEHIEADAIVERVAGLPDAGPLFGGRS